MNPDELVPLSVVRAEGKLSTNVLKNEIETGRLPVYRTARDRRQKLVRWGDVLELAKPQRVEVTNGVAA